jgi:hypothetical protein
MSNQPVAPKVAAPTDAILTSRQLKQYDQDLLEVTRLVNDRYFLNDNVIGPGKHIMIIITTTTIFYLFICFLFAIFQFVVSKKMVFVCFL